MSAKLDQPIIPWNNVIRFHKEIVKRAEESFYALPVLKQGTQERWTVLEDFAPHSLAGCWNLTIDQLTNKSFRLAVETTSNLEVFIGCLGWWQWKKQDNGQFVLDWKPVIYREVSTSFDFDSECCEIVPKDANWEFSPLVHELLERTNAAPSQPLDEILPLILQRASDLMEQSGRDLSTAILEIIHQYIPELAAEIRKPFPKDCQCPTPWILFSPSNGVSAKSRYLMADYIQLEKRLELMPELLGGLKLLDEPVNAIGGNEPKDDDFLSVVPLNESQSRAVMGALKACPVTVISGPPGCGKSQVVVSLMINAWAKGVSMLFASNNNQAVDVVKERLKVFEDDFPIAVRAGARQQNNITESLRRTLNIITHTSGSNTLATDAQADIIDLRSRREKLRTFLDNKQADRISQALNSAVTAYGEYKNAILTMGEERKKWKDELKNIGFPVEPENFEKEYFEPFIQWLKEGQTVSRLIDTDNHERDRISTDAASAQRRRDAAVQQVGLDSATVLSWTWLMTDPGSELLENWFKTYKGLLSEPLEQWLEAYEWEEGYEFWDGANEAKSWAAKARSLANDIRHAAGNLAPQIDERDKLLKEYEQYRSVVREMDIPETVSLEPEILAEWLILYAQYTTLPPGRFDWWPFSVKSKLSKQLALLESKAQLRAAYPLKVWRKIGNLETSGRDVLGDYIEKTGKWMDVRQAWDDFQIVCKDIEEINGRLCNQITELRINGLPKGDSLAEWSIMATTLEQRANYAEIAESAWKKKDITATTSKKVRTVLQEFRSIASGIPIKEAWLNGSGKRFYHSVFTLDRELSPETVVAARTALYEGTWHELIRNWEEARTAETERLGLVERASGFPTKAFRIHSWWSTRPVFLDTFQLVDGFTTPNDLPDEHHPLKQVADKGADWLKTWRRFLETTYQQENRRAQEEYEWATKHLQAAADNLPEGKEKDAATEHVKSLSKSRENTWEIELLQGIFDAFSPAVVNGKLAEAEDQLARLSFDIAKRQWLGRLIDDRSMQQKIRALQQHYLTSHNNIDPEKHGLFASVLKAMPIWITTANSPQAIPMEPELFDILVIDEATQCQLTNILPLIFRAKRLVVIGDPEQLPAINNLGPEAEKFLANKFGINKWLDIVGHTANDVYKTARNLLPFASGVVSLVEHYRSHPLIIGFVNRQVYRRGLRLRKPAGVSSAIPFAAGVYGCNVQGVSKRGGRNQSWLNEREAEAICDLLIQFRNEGLTNQFSIGIVTPFKAQCDEIGNRLSGTGLLNNVTIGTAHTFQGDEKDIMILSAVVAKGMSSGAAHWVEHPHNLLNVAVTRAREALYVVADFEHCRQQKGILGNLIKYVDKVEELRKTSEYELALFSHMMIQGWEPEIHVHIRDIEVDFVLENQGIRVVVEVDGSQHDEQTAQDESRDTFLRGQGYKVLRFKTKAVAQTPDLVIREISESLGYQSDVDLRLRWGMRP